MKIDCISDLHGAYPKLDGGDLLIVAGDLTAHDTFQEYVKCFSWIAKAKYKKKILVAGNHDNLLQTDKWLLDMTIDFTYLFDSGTEFEGLKIWGSPWTAQFKGINPQCCAFTENYGCDTDDWLEEYWKQIPDDTDILITHCPPYDIFDETIDGIKAGSKTLLIRSLDIAPKLHVFGHIHEEGGKQLIFKRPGIGTENNTIYINASHMNERYEPTHKPISIQYDKNKGASLL